MSAEPAVEPVVPHGSDPADLLIAIDKVCPEPTRPEYIEGTILVPPQPDNQHNKAAFKLSAQLDSAGFDLAGMGNGFRIGMNGRTLALIVPDFYVLRREPGELDEAYHRAHKGWYPSDMLALVGEVTSSNYGADTDLKLRAYAAAEVPVYLLIHRQESRAYAYSEPAPDPDPDTFGESHYRAVSSVELGGKLQLPAPYPVLDTGFLALSP